MLFAFVHKEDDNAGPISGEWDLFYYLNQMVDHKSCNPCSSPLRVNEQKRDVSLVVFHVRHHETKGDDDFFVKDDNTEIWILQALRQINPYRGQEKQSYKELQTKGKMLMPHKTKQAGHLGLPWKLTAFSKTYALQENLVRSLSFVFIFKLCTERCYRPSI